MKAIFFILSVSIIATEKVSFANPLNLQKTIQQLLAGLGLGHPDTDSDTEVSSSNPQKNSWRCYIPENTPVKAIAVINSSNIQGKVTFTQDSCSEPVSIMVSVTGLSPGDHGFHVHEKGDVSEGCTSMLGHFNPYKRTHGGPSEKIRHEGDLGNIQADDNGVSSMTFTDKYITLSGPRTIIGRGLVIHKDTDDFGKGGAADSLTTGNAGSRIACAVIGYM